MKHGVMKQNHARSLQRLRIDPAMQSIVPKLVQMNIGAFRIHLDGSMPPQLLK